MMLNTSEVSQIVSSVMKLSKSETDDIVSVFATKYGPNSISINAVILGLISNLNTSKSVLMEEILLLKQKVSQLETQSYRQDSI